METQSTKSLLIKSIKINKKGQLILMRQYNFNKVHRSKKMSHRNKMKKREENRKKILNRLSKL